MSKFFYNYKLWECRNSNFYKGMDSSIEKDALDVMRNSAKWGRFMLLLIDRWPLSCNQFLSDTSVNKRAWIGQASMACFLNVPASTTKKLWFMLGKKEQDMANKCADKAIIKWRGQC